MGDSNKVEKNRHPSTHTDINTYSIYLHTVQIYIINIQDIINTQCPKEPEFNSDEKE